MRNTRPDWAAAFIAAIAAVLLTVVVPPAGFAAGIASLLVVCRGMACRRSGSLRAVAGGVVAAVVCYLAIWTINSAVDPGSPASDSGSSAPRD